MEGQFILSFPGSGHQGLEMGRFRLPVHDVRVDVPESRFLQHALQGGGGEAQPAVRIQFPCLLLAVLEQVKNDQVQSTDRYPFGLFCSS